MAYRDSVGNNAHLLKRALTGVTDFAGRSRRTEVVYYWIASALIGVVFNFAMNVATSFETALVFDVFLRILLSIPMFALFVRRLHDQDQSGWWGLFLPLSIGLSIPRILTAFHGDIQAIVAQKTTPSGVFAGLCALAVFILCLLPGTDGPNRFGSDPRLEEV